MNSEYDAFAADFSATRKNAWPEFELLFPLLKKQDRILDLGCGNGRLRNFLEPDLIPAGNYFGLDVSDELLKIARQNHSQDHFFRGNFADKLPFGDENFDVVTAIASFHHLLNKKDQHNFLQESYRVLKPKGQIFMTTWKLPQKHFWNNLKKGRLKNWLIPFGKEKFPRIYRKTSQRELGKLLKKNGFKILYCELFREKNFVAIGEKL
jgi:ubiquinone/menaquinone biosynthesis C-methylase UbiE